MSCQSRRIWITCAQRSSRLRGLRCDVKGDGDAVTRLPNPVERPELPVLLPDPALSTGYGQDFIQRGWGSWGDAPYTDLMAITDAVEARVDIHGDKDYRVPIGEGLRLWWELLSKSGLPADEKGQSPHRFLYFPDENHWILQPQHALVWYEVVLGFIGEHVHGRTPTLPATLGLRDAATP